MNVIKRLEKLEQKITSAVEPPVIFRVFVGADGEAIQVNAWRNRTTGALVSRKSGESDDELTQRAIDAAKGDCVRYMPVI